MSQTSELLRRTTRLQCEMERQGVDLLALAPGPNMHYLLGFSPFPDERLCLLLLSRHDRRLVVPAINAHEVRAQTNVELLCWSDDRGPCDALSTAFGALALGEDIVLSVDATMRADVLLTLQDTIYPRRSVSSDGVMSALRIRKSPLEIQALADASAQADRALAVGVDACRPGKTERDVAEAIASFFRRDGAEEVNFTLVASAANSALPHHRAGKRTLEPGDTIVIDIGARLRGYNSDVTRVVHLGNPPPEVVAVYGIVQEANRRGREAAVPGALARDVDMAAREVIDSAGYGEYFVHRTGHGIGLEIHETPWITSESDTVLEPGMAFSVEPGIYLPGRFGVRIEDIVVIEKEGSRSLTGADHDLIIKF